MPHKKNFKVEDKGSAEGAIHGLFAHVKLPPTFKPSLIEMLACSWSNKGSFWYIGFITITYKVGQHCAGPSMWQRGYQKNV